MAPDPATPRSHTLPHLAASPSRKSRRRVVTTAAPLLSVLALIVTGCGGSGGGGGNAGGDPASIAPSNTVVYVAAEVQPQGSNKAAVEAISKKVLGVGNPGERIQSLLDQAIKKSKSGLSFKTDIKPWLGNRAAFAFSKVSGGSSSQAAVIVASKDNGKAQDAIDADTKGGGKGSYKGVDYRTDPKDSTTAEGVVGDFVVVGDLANFKAVVDASKGGSLAESSTYKSATSGKTDKLGYGYIDVKGFIDNLNASGSLPATQSQGLATILGNNPKPVTFTLDATPSSVTLETTSSRPTALGKSNPTQLVNDLPGDSFFALGIPALGPTLKKVVDQIGSGLGGAAISAVEAQLKQQTGLDLNRDVFGAIGDVGLFARGTSVLTIGGGAVIDSPTPAAANRLVSKVGALIKRSGARNGTKVGTANVAGAKGLRITSKSLPGAVNAVVKGSKIVIAYGDPATREALSPSKKLSDSPAFQQASTSLGGAIPTLYVAFDPIASLVGATGGSSSAQKYLKALNNIAVGTKASGNQQTARFVLNLK